MDLINLMGLAIEEAQKAFEKGEVPVGCLIVDDKGHILAKGHNLKETTQNPLKHAEMICLEEAFQKKGTWRLDGCTLITTLEPCLMCSGAIIHSRIDHVVYGAPDPKFGGAESLTCLFHLKSNHSVRVTSRIEEQKIAGLMKKFFQDIRLTKKSEKLKLE